MKAKISTFPSALKDNLFVIKEAEIFVSKRKYMECIVTDFGTVQIPDAVLKAYGVLHAPKKMDKRRREVQNYISSRALLERNVCAIASHQWTMGRDGVEL